LPWDLQSSGILRSAEKWFLTDVSVQPIGPIFQGQETQEGFLLGLVLEDGIDKMSGKIACPETSVRNYSSALRNNQEERTYHLLYRIFTLTWLVRFEMRFFYVIVEFRCHHELWLVGPRAEIMNFGGGACRIGDTSWPRSGTKTFPIHCIRQCLSVSQSVRLYVCLSVCLSVCQSVCLSVNVLWLFELRAQKKKTGNKSGWLVHTDAFRFVQSHEKKHRRCWYLLFDYLATRLNLNIQLVPRSKHTQSRL
jgi:hypothetical protein